MASKPANSMNLNSTTAGLANWDGTATMSSTAMAQYNVVSGASTSTINNIAPSTSGFVLTSNGASSQPTFQAIPFTQMPWTDEATSFNAAAGNGYFVTATSTATLPVSPSQGNTIAFVVDSAAGILTITANTGQKIQIGAAINTATAGTAASNKNGDSVTLVFRASDSFWLATSTLGSWTVS